MIKHSLAITNNSLYNISFSNKKQKERKHLILCLSLELFLYLFSVALLLKSKYNLIEGLLYFIDLFIIYSWFEENLKLLNKDKISCFANVTSTAVSQDFNLLLKLEIEREDFMVFCKLHQSKLPLNIKEFVPYVLI